MVRLQGVDRDPGDQAQEPAPAEAGGDQFVLHAKALLGNPFEHRMGRNYLKGRDGDRSNAVLAAAGYNFSLLLRWLARLLRALIRACFAATLRPQIA